MVPSKEKLFFWLSMSNGSFGLGSVLAPLLVNAFQLHVFTAEAILTCLFSRVSGVSMTASVTPAMVLAVCFHNNSSINYSTFSRLSPTTFRQDYRSCCQSSTTDQGPVQQVGRLQNNFHGSVRCISHGNTCTR